MFVKPGRGGNALAMPAGDRDLSGAPLTDAGDDFGFPAEDPVRPWPWWIALVGIAMAGIAIIMGAFAFGVVAAVFGVHDDALSDYDYLFGLVQDALWIGVAIAVPLLVVRWIRPEHLGLRPRKVGWSLLKLLVVLVGFYVLAAVYSAALGLTEKDNQLLQDTGFGSTLGKDLAYAILYPVAAPVAEELLFRGIVFKGLRDGLRGRLPRGVAVGIAALISGSIFGMAHLGGGQNDYIPVLVALGVLLALAYEWSGTLYVPIAIHSINNAIATGASSTPTHDWVYGVIAAGPLLALALAILVGRFVRLLPSTPPRLLAPSSLTGPSAWPPQDGPESGRPPGL